MPARRKLTTRNWWSPDRSVNELLREHHNSDYLDVVVVEDADHLHELLERVESDRVTIPRRYLQWAFLIALLIALFMPSVQTMLGHPVASGVLERLLDFLA